MADTTPEDTVKIRAHSPGRYAILVLELPTGELRTVYRETGYDLGRSKKVTEEWLADNAVGRHSFVEVNPPEEIPASALPAYAQENAREGP